MSREADLYKDKIEVSLDGRQIFYLFFGGAVIVGLVFVLGVMVGRRVEARGHVDRVRTTAAVDPLAALDRLEDKGAGMSFKGSLMGDPAPSHVEQTIDAIEKARAVKPEVKAAPPKPEDKKPEAPKEDKHAEKRDDQKDDAKDEKKDDRKDEKKDEKKPEKVDAVAEIEKKHVEKKKDEPKIEAKAEPKKLDEAKKLEEPKKAEPVADAKVDKPKLEDKKPEDAPKSKYTLQLSSFQDKSEAEAFLSTIKAQGYQAHVVEAAVSGKGTFYRVRMGSYKSIEAANDAKAEFEKASKKTASVMKI